MPTVETQAARIAAVLSTPDDIKNGIPLGFVIVVEWIGADDERYLSRIVADGTGKPDAMSEWTMNGMLEKAHSDKWPRDEDDDADGG